MPYQLKVTKYNYTLAFSAWTIQTGSWNGISSQKSDDADTEDYK